MKRNGDPLVYLKVIKIILESGESFYQRDQMVKVYQVIMSFYFIFIYLFFKFYFILKLYNIVLVLPNIKMKK